MYEAEGAFLSPEYQAKFLHNKVKAGLRPARPRLDRRARIQFCGILNRWAK